MANFIERIKDYFTRKDCADMAICTWKSDNEELYADSAELMKMADIFIRGRPKLPKMDGF